MRVYGIDNKDVVMKMIGGKMYPCVLLGEEGVGRTLSIVRVDPPLGENVAVIRPKAGHPGRPRIINQSPSPDGWLARLKTGNVSYKRNANGHVSAHPSFGIQVIACGWGAFGGAGRVGRWQDVLLQVPYGAWVRLQPAWGDPYIVLFESTGVYQMTYEEAALTELDLFGSTKDSERDLDLLDI